MFKKSNSGCATIPLLSLDINLSNIHLLDIRKLYENFTSKLSYCQPCLFKKYLFVHYSSKKQLIKKPSLYSQKLGIQKPPLKNILNRLPQLKNPPHSHFYSDRHSPFKIKPRIGAFVLLQQLSKLAGLLALVLLVILFGVIEIGRDGSSALRRDLRVHSPPVRHSLLCRGLSHVYTSETKEEKHSTFRHEINPRDGFIKEEKKD